MLLHGSSKQLFMGLAMSSKTVKVQLKDFNKTALMNDASKENLFECSKKDYNTWQQKIAIENPGCSSKIIGSE